MPELEGDLEEWQTEVINVTRGEAKGDISRICHSPRSPKGQSIVCFVIPDSSTFHAHINVHYFCPNTLVFLGDNTTRSITISLY